MLRPRQKSSRGVLVLVGCMAAIAAVIVLRTSRRPAVDQERRPASVGLARQTRVALPHILASPATAEVAGDMSISGSVVSRLDGNGVEGQVTFSDRGRAYSVNCAPDGTFHFQPPEAGTYQVASISAQGFLPFTPAWGDSPLVFSASPGYRIDGVVLRLEPTKDILIKVTDMNGVPVPSATVAITIPTTTGTEALSLGGRAQTDTQGLARTSAPVGAVVTAERNGFATGRAQLMRDAWSRGELSVRLPPAEQTGPPLTISGTVVDAKDTAIPDVVITARPTTNDPFSEDIAWWNARGAEDGRFTLGGLSKGRYTLSAVSPGRVAARVENIEAGSSGVVLRLSNEGGWIAGRVVSDLDSKPIPSFVVILSRAVGKLAERPIETRSYFNAQGGFLAGPLEPASYILRVAAHRRATSNADTVQVTVGDTTRVEVRMSAGGTLRGKVVDAVTSQGIAGARLLLEGSILGEGLPLALETTAVAGAGGTFTMEGVPPGPRSLSASASGYNGRITSGIDIKEGSAEDAGEIRLTPVVPGAQARVEITGVGAALAPQGDVLVVGQVLEGGGAVAAGIVAGDEILAIDGTPVGNMDFNGAMQRIRGPAGTTVVLRLKRANRNEENVTVTRRKVQAPAPPQR
jgi:hypothetical protein